MSRDFWVLVFVPWYDFIFCLRFTEILSQKSALQCMIHWEWWLRGVSYTVEWRLGGVSHNPEWRHGGASYTAELWPKNNFALFGSFWTLFKINQNSGKNIVTWRCILHRGMATRWYKIHRLGLCLTNEGYHSSERNNSSKNRPELHTFIIYCRMRMVNMNLKF